MDGRESSLSLRGEGYPRPQSAAGRRSYKVISETAAVDETLFGSHRDRGMVKNTSRTNSGHNISESGKRRVPAKLRESLSITNHCRSDSKRGKPSYVDETLFGRKLDIPDFEPPWAEKNEPKFKDRPLCWSPPVVGSLSDTPTSRPATAQIRLSSRLSQQSSSSMGSNSSKGSLPPHKPPWR